MRLPAPVLLQPPALPSPVLLPVRVLALERVRGQAREQAQAPERALGLVPEREPVLVPAQPEFQAALPAQAAALPALPRRVALLPEQELRRQRTCHPSGRYRVDTQPERATWWSQLCWQPA
ncbi:hypothetical protein RHIZ404_210556 [Rhizobium sp. EC-SD404]|nr:hypothetical protein RHIZ404_210556 [Rhizobium sp. EC-SD404]